MKKKNYTWLYILGGFIFLILIILLWIGGTYNNFIGLDEGINNAWSQVLTAYQRRADLIPNLVESSKKGLEFQKETLTKITALRSGAESLRDQISNAKTPEELESFGKQLDQIAKQTQDLINTQINIQVEAYPDLDIEPILSLMDELAGTENRIKVERDLFNKAVQNYNVKVRRFPSNILAGMFGFEKKSYFKAETGAEKAPEVKFD